MKDNTWTEEKFWEEVDNEKTRQGVVAVCWEIYQDYEHELATRNETIGNLQGELRNMHARIAEASARLGEIEPMAAKAAELEAEIDRYWRKRESDLELRIAELETQLQPAQKIVTAAVAWYGLRHMIVTQDPEDYYQKCHDLEMAVLELGAVQP